jgi:AraC-like DNA-binding protein
MVNKNKMRFIFEEIDISLNESFITRRMKMDPKSYSIHAHRNFELNCITAGAGRRIVGNHISTYTSGEIVLLGPNIFHCWEVLETADDGLGECVVTHFKEDFLHTEFFNIPELHEVRSLLNEAKGGILFKGPKTRKIAESLNKMVRLEGLERYIELLKVFRLLLRITDREYLSSSISMPDKYRKGQEQIEKIYEYVTKNIKNKILLNEVSKLVYMEPSSFCRYFKRKTNRTFMEYVKHVRIGDAARLLAETDKQISQICYECGYSNLANFNYYFKQITKKTPSQYRKSFQR